MSALRCNPKWFTWGALVLMGSEPGVKQSSGRREMYLNIPMVLLLSYPGSSVLNFIIYANHCNLKPVWALYKMKCLYTKNVSTSPALFITMSQTIRVWDINHTFIQEIFMYLFLNEAEVTRFFFFILENSPGQDSSQGLYLPLN